MEVAQTKNKYIFEEVMIREKKFMEQIFGILLLYMLFLVMSYSKFTVSERVRNNSAEGTFVAPLGPPVVAAAALSIVLTRQKSRSALRPSNFTKCPR